MTEQSTSELERDAERVRAQIAETAENLKDKMSPGQLMDEVVNYFKEGDTNQLLNNLKHQVRDNPLALALVGSGLAWLMMGSGPSGTTGLPSRNPLAGEGAARRPMAGSNTYGGTGGSSASASSGSGFSDTMSSLGDKASSLGDKASSLGSRAAGMTSSAGDAATRTMHDVRDGVSDGLGHAAAAGSAAMDRARSTFLDALDREPLVLGALGVAVGAAIGAMLPSTRMEKDYLGAASSKMRSDAEGLVSEGIHKAEDIASDVYQAARDEADKQGLVPHGKPLTDKLTDVANAAGAELKAATSEGIDDAGKKADATSDTWSPGKSRP